ncbi:hypothetical protein [Tabrizicola soli]|uniref:Uncharacterized protein n=1 Tax=Tabrizicola soli TaxID=2185115 RepID=A0ABV7DUG5_9RHOB|nr:hypothetical protein [Tabrizicola soli]
MAKDIITGSKRKSGKSKQSSASFRTKHRVYSAASAERKKAAGMCRVSVWVPSWAEDILKRFAKRLCEGSVPDDIGRAQAGHGKIGGRGSIPPRPRRKRKTMPCDARQLDLFGPV